MTRLLDPFDLLHNDSKSHEENIKYKNDALIESMTKECLKKPVTKRFEYTSLSTVFRNITKECNSFGLDGWEAFYVYIDEMTPMAIIYFKREIIQ